MLGKFLAAWAFLCLAILLSFPMALTVAYLGDPDWGVIATGYLGSMLMAGAYLGICSLTSAFTKNQVISFVISVFVCFLLVLLGWSVFTDFLGGYLALPAWLVDVGVELQLQDPLRRVHQGHRRPEGRHVLPLARRLLPVPERARAGPLSRAPPCTPFSPAR